MLISGVLTKSGIYGIIRLTYFLFQSMGLGTMQFWLVFLGSVSMFVCVTPGTITLDIAEDKDGKTWYYIHWIDVVTAEPEKAGEIIKGRLERGIRRFWE